MAPFVLMRFLSFNPYNRKFCSVMDKYTFQCRREIMFALMWKMIPKQSRMPFYKYIKKPEEEKGEYGFLIEKIKNQYDWSEKDVHENMSFIKHIFKDKNILKDYFTFYGIEMTYYKKYGINTKEEKEEKIDEQQTGLMRWKK